VGRSQRRLFQSPLAAGRGQWQWQWQWKWGTVHLPLAVAVLGASTAALVALGSVRRWWSSAVRLQYAALAVAALALVPLLAGWDLIG
jgi:hypothetical protein